MAFFCFRQKDHPKLYLWAKNWEKTDIPKIDIEPVPIMEMTKSEAECVDVGSENSRRADVLKVEAKLSLKDDQDEKSIASDSELMKILEEDSTHSDESRVSPKKEGLINSKDSHILLDALTSSNSDGKQKNIDTPDVKNESTGTRSTKCKRKKKRMRIQSVFNHILMFKFCRREYHDRRFYP